MKRAVLLRLFSIVLALAIATPLHAAFAADGDVAQLGDLNGDGGITAADAAHALRLAAGQQPADATVSIADVTGDLSVSAGDATAILLRATGRINDFFDLVGKLNGALLGERYAERFSYLGPIMTDTSYRSDMVSVTLHTLRYYDSNCYLADIYIRDISSFATAFSGGEYRGGRETVLKMATDNDAVIAINGDFYSYRSKGPVVRNGVVYKDSIDDRVDICVLYRDGRLVTFEKGVTFAEILAEGDPYHAWAFGPMLLDANGEALTEFNCGTSILGTNPRAAIGYYEPGHYCFLLVDGRQGSASRGMTMEQLSAFFQELGCKAAYNFDGGQTAVMASKTGVVNEPFAGGRSTSDILYIGAPLLQEDAGAASSGEVEG